MIYKSLFLVAILALFVGINNSNAQATICEIEDAVVAVYDAAGEDYDVGNSLHVHLEKLKHWCDKDALKPFKSKKPNILMAMGSNVEERLFDGGYWEIVEDVQTWIPMPVEVEEALEILGGLLVEEFSCDCEVNETP